MVGVAVVPCRQQQRNLSGSGVWPSSGVGAIAGPGRNAQARLSLRHRRTRSWRLSRPAGMGCSDRSVPTETRLSPLSGVTDKGTVPPSGEFIDQLQCHHPFGAVSFYLPGPGTTPARTRTRTRCESRPAGPRPPRSFTSARAASSIALRWRALSVARRLGAWAVIRR